MKGPFLYILILAAMLWSCKKETIEAGFEDVNELTIYDYVIENQEQFSSFLSIIQKGGISNILSAYNPNATNYTLFLPDNEAVDQFINQSAQFSTLNDLLNDNDYVRSLCRYHVLALGVRTNEFPFGTFPEPTLSKDNLTVSFIINSDTSYYKINNQAPIISPNIELSNGYIHVIQSMLIPVVYTTYGWIENNPEYSIFKNAVDLTGFRPVIDKNLKEPGQEYLQPVTLLVESDDIFEDAGIFSVDDLANLISPGNANYTDETNPLYNYVGYHVLKGNKFLNDFEGVATNYNTFTQTPLNINGAGIDIVINRGKQVFDTLIIETDTTIIDYVGVLYDNSNVITRSGVIHFIDQIMEQQKPTRARVTFEFHEEPLLEEYWQQSGTYLVTKDEAFTRLEWSGADLYAVKTDEESSSASYGDFLQIDGGFTISYMVPEIVPGKYDVVLRADAFNPENAFVEVYIDGSRIGGLVNLAFGGSSENPFQNKQLGSVDFRNYKEHKIEIKALISGSFLWDNIRFEPI